MSEIDDRQESDRLRRRFDSFVLDGIPQLRKLGYNPTQFLTMVKNQRGVVSATKTLLADPRHTSYGFERLRQLGRLDASVEYAACLPWFEDLFTPSEIEEARTRLILHDFPLDAALDRARTRPPSWVYED